MKTTLQIPVEIFHYDGSDESRDAVAGVITDAGGTFRFLPYRETDIVQFWPHKHADWNDDLIISPGEYLVRDDAGHFFRELTVWSADELAEVGYSVVGSDS